MVLVCSSVVADGADRVGASHGLFRDGMLWVGRVQPAPVTMEVALWLARCIIGGVATRRMFRPRAVRRDPHGEPQGGGRWMGPGRTPAGSGC